MNVLIPALSVSVCFRASVYVVLYLNVQITGLYARYARAHDICLMLMCVTAGLRQGPVHVGCSIFLCMLAFLETIIDGDVIRLNQGSHHFPLCNGHHSVL